MKRSIDSTRKFQPVAPRGKRHRTQLAGHVWGDGVPTLAVLAAPYGIRVYRDTCGDENLPGRFGEVFRHGPDCLAVQFGGVRANGTQTDDPRKVRWRLRKAQRTEGLRRIRVGREEALFHCPDALLPRVAHLIGAYQAYRKPGPSGTLADAA